MPPNLQRGFRPVISKELTARVLAVAEERGLQDLSPSSLITIILRQWVQGSPNPLSPNAVEHPPEARPLAASSTDDVRTTGLPDGGREMYARRVLEYLADAANDQGVTGPIGFKAMAKQLDISPSFAKNLVRLNVENGSIEVCTPRLGSRGATYRVSTGRRRAADAAMPQPRRAERRKT